MSLKIRNVELWNLFSDEQIALQMNAFIHSVLTLKRRSALHLSSSIYYFYLVFSTIIIYFYMLYIKYHKVYVQSSSSLFSRTNLSHIITRSILFTWKVNIFLPLFLFQFHCKSPGYCLHMSCKVVKLSLQNW